MSNLAPLSSTPILSCGPNVELRLAPQWPALLCFLLGTTFLSGCSETAKKLPQTDEAMKRALVEGTSIAEAAKYYSYRTTYRPEPTNQPADDDTRTSRRVYDYFAGMDAVSQVVPAETGNGNPSYPDQLLDRVMKDDQGNIHRSETVVEPLSLTDDEIIGRNTWMVWCAGNEGFWDWLANENLGFIDLLKLVDSRERARRFSDKGLINEPEMQGASGPVAGMFGLWIDRPVDDRIRRWQEIYLKKTFEQIAAGQHKSQIGLDRKGKHGSETGAPLYVGDPKAYKGEGYLYPSQYLRDDDAYEERSAYENGEADDLDTKVPPPDLYGLSSGVIGLRLFPNPYFDADAQKKWDPERYISDKSYWSDPNLVRPFRVGMSCAFCHASFHPLKPPRDLHFPSWNNLSGNIGAQYLRMRPTVGNLLEPNQFVYHLLESQPPGTIDTSLIASDNINNPNTMNAVFGLRQRAMLSLFNPRERLSRDSATLPSLWTNPNPEAPASAYDRVPAELQAQFEKLGIADKIAKSNANPRYVPRILLDGSDSIGAWGALARVYLNIGSYWEQWNEIHQVVIGFQPQSPFRLKDCETNSVYWNATSQRVPGLRDYFLKITPPMPLLSTENSDWRFQTFENEVPQGQAVEDAAGANPQSTPESSLRVDVNKLSHGREVFVRNCIVCHSSIQPETMHVFLSGDLPAGDFKDLVDRRNRVRFAAEENGEFWEHDPAQWLNDDYYLDWARKVVEKPAFWTENFLSTDYRIPVNVVGTNAGRAMATNGLSGHMWQDFASESYRNLPSPGPISFFNPYKGEAGEMDEFMPQHKTPSGAPSGGGGPGYYRVPTLISIWATAPFLHNNSLGLFNNDPSVDGRLKAFDDAIRKLLWPEKRLESNSYNEATPERLKRDHGLIWRTTTETYLVVDAKRVPHQLQRFAWVRNLKEYLPWLSEVRPVWLPTVALMTCALVILLFNNSSYRRKVAYGLFASSVVVLAVFLFIEVYPNVSLWKWLAGIRPRWLPPAILATLVLVLWLPLSGTRIGRRTLAIIAGLTVTLFLVVVLVAVFPNFSVRGILLGLQPRWFLIVGLPLLALILWLPISPTWLRWLGYWSLLFSLLLGAVVYFNAGEPGDLRIGPIPAGTPVNLLANFNSESERSVQVQSLYESLAGLSEIDSRHLQQKDAESVMKKKIAPALMLVNKCPDFVMDRGHYYPWFDSMTDADKEALIELLKTF